MNILSIGNSFSQDAQRYLHRLAKHDGIDMKTVNLYIGGCPLRRHYLNMLDDTAAYDFEFNGEATGIKVSLRQALASDEWDVVTLQQASPLSGQYETYEPYIEELAAYVRRYCPHARLLIHQTWAYEDGSERLIRLGYASAEDMLSALCNCYSKAAEAVGAHGIIPCGEAMMRAQALGIAQVHRDTFHASLGVGRYVLALCWYKALTKRDITGNRFCDFDVPVTEQERRLAIQAVDAVLRESVDSADTPHKGEPV